jgi:hypothetical protein
VTPDVHLRLLEAQEAMSNPIWRLFRQMWAPVVLATIIPVYEENQSVIPVEQFHVQAARVMAAMRQRDPSYPIDPDDPRAVRTECRSWVEGDRWLERHGEADGEVYRLTPEAREVIAIVSRLRADDPGINASRVQLVLGRVHSLAVNTTIDPVERMRGLNDQIRDLEHQLVNTRAEIERLELGGEVEVASDDYVLTEFLSIRAEINELPRDIKRVEDSYRSLVQQLRDDYLAEVDGNPTRSHGEIVADYIQRSQDLATADRYGRGFQAAKELLTDDRAQSSLLHDLARIVEHPFAEALDDRDRAELRRTVHMIADSVHAVLDQRRAMTDRLVRFIASRDAVRQRHLNDLLNEAFTELGQWASGHGARATIPLPVSPAPADVATFRRKAATKRVPTPIRPLSASGGTAQPDVDVDAMRAKGGPHYADLRRAIADATREGRGIGGAQLFDALPEHARRPVDIHGLLHLATQQYALRPDVGVEEFHAIRPGGEAVTYLVPEVTFLASPTTDQVGDPVAQAAADMTTEPQEPTQ